MHRRLALLGIFSASLLQAQVTFYSGANAFTNWQGAAGATPVTLSFEPISAGTQANDPTFVSYAATAGVVFRPFANNNYPRIEIGQGGIGTIGANWLGNALAIGYGSGNAISFTFNQSIRAFGFYDVGSDDGFEVTVYSTGLTSLGSFNTQEVSGTPLFWGFIANQNIGQVDIRPRTGNGYIGIDALSTVAVPEPATFALLGVGAAMVGLAWRRRAKPA